MKFWEKLSLIAEEKLSRVLLLPALVMIAIFIVFPIVWSIYLSFTNYSTVGPTAINYTFVGLRNYFKLFSALSEFPASIRNSFIFTLFSALIGQVVLGLGLAILWRMRAPEGIFGKVFNALRSITITVVFISWIIPEVVAGYAWAAITDSGGVLTSLFGYREPLYVVRPLDTIIIANLWRGTAFSMILFMAALESIPGYIYEAAEIDGTTPWQKFRYVTLPLIAHAIIVDLILITIWTFGVFTMPFMLLGPRGDILWTLYVYQQAVQAFDPALASAASNIMFLIVLALIFAYFRVLSRITR